MAEAQWNIKDKKGRIFGPLNTSKIIELIRGSFLDEEDLISPANTERWVKLSVYPEFYDVILETLRGEGQKPSDHEISKKLEELLSLKEESPVSLQNQGTGFTPGPPPKRGRVIVEEDLSQKKATLKNQTTKSPPQPPQKKTLPETILVLKEEEPFLKKEKNKYALILATLLILLGLFGYVFYDEIFEKRAPQDGKIHLIYPRTTRAALSLQESQEMLGRARNLFQRDEFSGYYEALEVLVRLLEANPKNRDAISLLCLTYRELWPYSYQDSNDLQNLTKLVQLAQSEDSMGISGATCRAVQASLTAEIDPFNSLLQTLLNDFPTAAVLYEMKASILFIKNQTAEAIAYIQKTEGLWPQWLKSYFVEAKMRISLNDYYNAAKILKGILEKNPKHTKAQVELGILELTQFHNEKGLDMILLGLEDKRLSSRVQVDGYTALTNFYISTQPQKALEYAKKAFAIDPRNTYIRNTILSLGGEAALASVRAEDSELIILGDSYFKNKNYFAAQAEYKTAFETNPKNAMAALKTAQSLWKLNQTKEAINWAIKAVRADPKMSEAYVQLSDYYSQKYDFKAASEMLAKAKAETKLNYLIMRAYAQLEMRRRDAKTAQKYAENALKLYDADIESLNILAEAYMAQNQFETAYQYASKAISLDANNAHSQETYAKSLFGMRGGEIAEDYVKNLINTYPNNNDYRVILAKILIQDGKLNQAITTLQQVVAIEPSQMEAFQILGDSYVQMNQPNEALKAYIKAASLDPSGAESLYKIGQVFLLDKSTIGKALTQFQKVIEINPRFPRAYYYAGKAALLLGQTKKAIEYAEMEKRVNPEIADPYILLSEIYMLQNQYSEAANNLRRATQLRPNDSGLYVQLAKAYRLSGQFDVATSMLRIAINKESGNADIYREQGAVFERRGENEQAAAAYRRYLELKPNAEDRAEIQARLNQL